MLIPFFLYLLTSYFTFINSNFKFITFVRNSEYPSSDNLKLIVTLDDPELARRFFVMNSMYVCPDDLVPFILPRQLARFKTFYNKPCHFDLLFLTFIFISHLCNSMLVTIGRARARENILPRAVACATACGTSDELSLLSVIIAVSPSDRALNIKIERGFVSNFPRKPLSAYTVKVTHLSLPRTFILNYS